MRISMVCVDLIVFYAASYCCLVFNISSLCLADELMFIHLQNVKCTSLSLFNISVISP